MREDRPRGRDEIWNNYREKSWRVKLSPFLFRWPKFKKWNFENIKSWERKLERERESINFLHLLPFTYLCNNFVPLLASWNDSNATICSLNFHGHHPRRQRPSCFNTWQMHFHTCSHFNLHMGSRDGNSYSRVKFVSC